MPQMMPLPWMTIFFSLSLFVVILMTTMKGLESKMSTKIHMKKNFLPLTW